MALKSVGKFQIVGPLGKGAHSQIVHIRRTADAKHYALKIVPINDADERKYYEQAKHEFRVAQMLEHPNLIKVYCLEMHRDWFFRLRRVHLLIEYVNGKTVDQVQRLSLPRLVQLFAKVAGGLAHMHRRGVCHADLKPNNILLSRTGEVKVIDYGLAWIKGEEKERVQGTPEYMAPEQARKGTVNEQTDIYNFGVTMYRLTTWRLPPSTVAAPGQPPVNAKIFEDLLKPVQEFSAAAPKELCDLIHRCLSFQPHHRPERVGLILDGLTGLVKKLVRKPEDELDAMEW